MEWGKARAAINTPIHRDRVSVASSAVCSLVNHALDNQVEILMDAPIGRSA